MKLDTSDWQQSGLLALFLTTMIIVLAILVGKLTDLITIKQAVIGGMVVLLETFGVFFLTYKLLMAPMSIQLRQERERLSENLSALQSSFDVMAAVHNADWLITVKQLIEMEAKTTTNEIWVITRNLDDEIDEGLFGMVIRQNVARGIVYTYFVPDNPTASVRFQKLVGTLGSFTSAANMRLRKIDSPLFDIISAQDMVIFGPTGSDMVKMRGYMNLPIETGGGDYAIELGPKYCEQVVATLSQLEQHVVKLA